MKFWIQDGNTPQTIKKFFVKDGTTVRTIKRAFIQDGSTVRQFYTSNAGTPSIQNFSGTAISTQYIGLTLYGYAGDNALGSYSFAWQYSSDGTTWNTETGTGASGTGSGNSVRKTYVTDLTDDNVFIRYAVTYNGITNYSSSVTITKRKPVLNITTYPTDPILTGTAQVGQTLSTSSHWIATTTITNDTLPDYYIATWTGSSGTTTYSSRSSDTNYNVNWNQYVIASGDLNGTVSVYLTAYNSGGNTVTATRTSATVVSGLGAFTYQAYDASVVPTTPSTPTFSMGTGSYIDDVFVNWTSSKPTDTDSYTEYFWGTAYYDGTTYTSTNPQYMNSSGVVNGWAKDGSYSPTGANTYEDFWPINRSGTFYEYVVATGNSRKAGVSWTTSTNANSYKINYTISGNSNSGVNGTYTSSAVTASPYVITVDSGGGTVAFNSVTAYSTTDGTGSNTKAATLATGQSSSVTPVYQTATSPTGNANVTYTTPAAGDPYFTFTQGSTSSQGYITVYSTGATTITYSIYRTGNGSGATSTGYGNANTYSLWDSGTFSAASGTYYLPRNGYYYMSATASNATGSNANGTKYSNTNGQTGTVANWAYAGTPLAPTSPSVAKSSTSPSSILNVSWTAPSQNSGTTYTNNVETYEIYWLSSNTTPASTATADYSNVTSPYGAAAPASTTRHYWVRSRNSTNTQSGQTLISAWVYAGSATTDAATSKPPNNPTGLTTPSSGTSPSLVFNSSSWTAPVVDSTHNAATYYQVYFEAGTSSTGPWTAASNSFSYNYYPSSPLTTATNANSNTTYVSVYATSVSSGTITASTGSYTWVNMWVRAANADGYSGWVNKSG